MSLSHDTDLRAIVEAVYRSQSRAVLATLIRLLGDFQLAEEALHEAFRTALEQWAREGVPRNPRAWLISVGRFRSIDRLRREARFDSYDPDEHDIPDEAADAAQAVQDESDFNDDRLRLIFTCCHPALAPDAQVALTLREVCGLATEEIARAFLTPTPTVAQRIVRAKAKIRSARIPYEVPGAEERSERLEAVLRVVYLVFNEGYTATGGKELMRQDLASEAIRLGRLLVELMPEPEAMGLLALMLLQDSRRAARSSAAGDLTTLEEQDRALWDRGEIEEGSRWVERALAARRPGSYTLQAAVAAAHCRATRWADTDWRRIVELYDLLLRAEPSPVIELNRAVAVSMRDGPAEGLALVDRLLESGRLADYRLAHAARADLCRRLGRVVAAREAYARALALTEQEVERRFLERRLAELPRE